MAFIRLAASAVLTMPISAPVSPAPRICATASNNASTVIGSESEVEAVKPFIAVITAVSNAFETALPRTLPISLGSMLPKSRRTERAA